MSSAPRMNLTQFCQLHGLPTSHDVQSHIHAGLRCAPTTKTYRRWFDSELKRLQADRDECLRKFREAVANGEIIDADTCIDLERVAQGHEDHPATQAAKRLLAKRSARKKEVT